MTKNVLHIHQKFLPYQGGSTQRLLNLIKGSSDNYRHIVICENSENVESYSEIDGIEIYRYKKHSHIPSVVMKIKKKLNVDIVHYHNYRPGFWGSITKIIFPKAKTLFELHSIYIPSTRLGRILSKVVHFISDEALVLSKASVLALEKQGFKKKISVIYNGIDLDKFKKSSIDIPQLDFNCPIIGYIGSLEKFQGVDTFCQIAKVVKEIRNDICFVVIGGNSSDHNKFKEISGDSVIYYEFFSPNIVPSVYKKFKFLLMTRPTLPETESAVPLKPIEALAAGIPVMSTNVGGMRELKNELSTDNIKLFDRVDDITKFLLSEDLDKCYFDEDCNLNMFDKNLKSHQLEKVYEALINE